MKDKSKILDLKKGQLVRYNFLFSNEDDKFGIILKIKEDLNFSYMISILNELNEVDLIPFSIMDYTIINENIYGRKLFLSD